jgi:hypothetical protein
MQRFQIYVDQNKIGTPDIKGIDISEEVRQKLTLAGSGLMWKTYEVDAETMEEANSFVTEHNTWSDTDTIRSTNNITKEHIEANPEWEDSFK